MNLETRLAILRVAKLYDELVHPVRVQVMCVVAAATGPISVAQMAAGPLIGLELGLIAYHVRWLFDRHWLAIDSKRQVRGATETFWRLPNELATGHVQALQDLAEARS